MPAALHTSRIDIRSAPDSSTICSVAARMLSIVCSERRLLRRRRTGAVLTAASSTTVAFFFAAGVAAGAAPVLRRAGVARSSPFFEVVWFILASPYGLWMDGRG